MIQTFWSPKPGTLKHSQHIPFSWNYQLWSPSFQNNVLKRRNAKILVPNDSGPNILVPNNSQQSLNAALYFYISTIYEKLSKEDQSYKRLPADEYFYKACKVVKSFTCVQKIKGRRTVWGSFV